MFSVLRPASHAVLLLLAATCLSTPAAHAGKKHSSTIAKQTTQTFAPVMAVVGLNGQRVSFYDAHGSTLRAPVSSGQKGLDTPAGVYAVLEKDIDHHSNVYDDAAMPFMQRITWTGLALHAGVLPGHPASHGCVRMPYSFAENIFPLTEVGMRVVISPDDFAPIPITHPFLSQLVPPVPKAAAALTTKVAAANIPGRVVTDTTSNAFLAAHDSMLKSVKAIAAAAQLTAKKASDRATALKAAFVSETAAHARAAEQLRAAMLERRLASDQRARASGALSAAQSATLGASGRDAVARAITASRKAAEAVEEARASADAAAVRLSMAQAGLLATADKSLPRKEARRVLSKRKQELVTAERRLRAAVSKKHEANARIADAERNAFTSGRSRSLKRLEETKDRAQKRGAVAAATYASADARFQDAVKRLAGARASYSAAETARTEAVAAAAVALGRTRPVSLFVSLKTRRLYVRQAFEPVLELPMTIEAPQKPIGTHVFTAVGFDDQNGTLRWTAVSVGRKDSPDHWPKLMPGLDTNVTPTNSRDALAVLDRLSMPPEIVARYSGFVWPGSSIIVSGEQLSSETGSGTDFIVVMSSEPQGGLKSRKSEVAAARRKRAADVDKRYDRYQPEQSSFFSFW